MAWNFARWCILTTYIIYQFTATVCLFLQFWRYFDLAKWIKFGLSGHFLENAWRKWPEILQADLAWPLSEPISLWLQSVDFSHFGAILTQWNGSNLGFPRISWVTHRENGLKFCMLMYLDHFQNYFVLGYGLLIFAILALFWLSETGQIWGFWAFPGERMEGMA